MLAGRLFCLLHGLSPLPQLSNILRRKTKKDFRFCHVIKKKHTRYFIIFLIMCSPLLANYTYSIHKIGLYLKPMSTDTMSKDNVQVQNVEQYLCIRHSITVLHKVLKLWLDFW